MVPYWKYQGFMDYCVQIFSVCKAYLLTCLANFGKSSKWQADFDEMIA